MAKLIYSVIASLDGYTADAQGNFDWAAPDQEVHAFVNDLERGSGTYLYGRRMYETMAPWDTMGMADEPQVICDFAEIWRGTDKIVYSSTMQTVSTARTRIERSFDPDAVKALKARVDRDISIGGAGLAARAIAAGLVDEYQIIFAPAVVGGGTRFLPDGVRLELELLEERRFRSGFVFLRYRSR